ncbi:MAG: hypothetical protein ACLS3M_07015 [Collinsella sp.]
MGPSVRGVEINKILTIEASGIGMACTAQHFGGVPVVFAKKAQSINLDGEQYATTIYSFTADRSSSASASVRGRQGPDRTTLANGCALEGLIKICEAAGAEVSVLALRGEGLAAVAISSASVVHVEPGPHADMDCETGEITFACARHKRLVCDVTKGHIFCMRGGVI